MAKLSYSGFEVIENQLEKLGRDTVRRLVEAGAKELVKTTQEDIRQYRHIQTGAMEKSVKPGAYHETLEGGWMDVYPQGEDRRGVSNAKKAFVINYGYGKRKTAKTGDKFITGNMKKRQSAITAAMEAENNKIINEANGGTQT